MKMRLAAIAVALGALLPLGMTVSHASAATPTENKHWACVGEIDVNIGVCIDNPIPPPPFGYFGLGAL